MKIFTLTLSTPFYDMYFFVYNNLRQLVLPQGPEEFRVNK